MQTSGPTSASAVSKSPAGTALGETSVDAVVEAFELARAEGRQVAYWEFLPEPDHPAFADVATELVRVDMEQSWEEAAEARQRGKTVADYRRELPELLSDASVLDAIAFEEYRLRAQAGESVSPSAYGSRYGVDTRNWPSWKRSAEGEVEDASERRPLSDQLRDHALTLAADVEDLPEAGETFAGFHLQRQLAQGAFARVFLANEQELANRRVVLKIAAGRSLEPEHLARLQHTNIMPIYSVHRRDRFTAVCMPLLGVRTLADLIVALRNETPEITSEQNLVSTFLKRSDATLATNPTTPEAGPAMPAAARHQQKPPQIVEAVSEANYVNAVVWIVQQLALGLEHAHQRGIVHRDLKPANLLLSDEGLPLVLDFNLSEEVVVHGPANAVVGGTLPYMSPEQLRAVLSGGRLGPSSDVFSLGVIFYELLTGRRPYPDRRGAFDDVLRDAEQDRHAATTPVHRLNRAVPRSISAVIHRCLEPLVDRRYQSMAELAEDLGRHLEDRPLRYASDRSVTERAKKWARRHPRLSSAAAAASAAGVVLLMLVVLLVARGRQLDRTAAEIEWNEFSNQLPSIYMAIGMPPDDAELLEDGLARARAAVGRYAVLNDADWKDGKHYGSLGAEQQRQLDRRLAETLFLMASANAELRRRSNDAASSGRYRDDALRLIQLARDVVAPDPPPRELVVQQARVLETAGQSDAAAKLREQAAHCISDPDLRRYAKLLALHRARDYGRAIPVLTELRNNNPDDPAPWLLLANAFAAQGKLHEAESYYATSIALEPDSYVSHLNRGLCFLELGQFEQAIADFDRVIALQPQLACGYLNRAVAFRGAERIQEAIDDLTTALELNAPQTRIYFLRSRLRAQLGDDAGAADDLAIGLSSVPRDELSWIARGIARLKTDPKAALADFRRALALNPASSIALRNCVHVLADRLDRPDEALVVLDQLLELNAQDANALAGRAVVFARQGRREEAIADVQSLLRASQESDVMFRAACALSLTSAVQPHDVYRALTLLTRAVVANPALLARARSDPDLAKLRETDEYQQLLESVAKMNQLTIDLYRKSATGVQGKDRKQTPIATQ